jgi:hypothetical protein
MKKEFVSCLILPTHRIRPNPECRILALSIQRAFGAPKRGASAKAEVRENANTQRTSKSKANMRERICFCSADFLKSFLGLGSAPQEGRGRNAGRKFFWFFGGGYGWKKNFKNGKIIL